VAAGHSVDPARWQELFEELLGRVAGRFGRVEPRRRARVFVRGLLADLPRKNCWTIAEHAGDASPDGMQHLLGRAVWDEDAVRDDIRDCVVEHLGDPGAVLVIDETGDLKKGTTTVGVKRQYTGTAGRVENAQVAVYLVYATDAGHAMIDRELYLPRSWTDDPERLQAAGLPTQVGFATKPKLATAMICRALEAGVPAGWVTGDEVYGANPGLRAELEARQIGYVLAVACDHPVGFGGTTQRADALLRQVPARAWQQISCGKGAKGHRYYDWAFLRLDHHDPAPDGQAGKHWLMLRRNQRTGELAFYHCFTPRPVPLAVLVKVAGRRWTIEEAFQCRQGPVRPGPASGPPLALLVPLDHPRHGRARLPGGARRRRAGPTSDTAWLIGLTCSELQHLFAALLVQPAGDGGHRLRWSVWRRRHQHRARACHYRRQATQP
jgi:SRSO17 transposase